MKQYLNSILVLCAAASVSAQTTATYDDVTVAPVPLQPVGTYKGLTYNAFNFANQGKLAVGGVKSQSGTNRIASSFEIQEMAGTPSISIAKGTPYTSFSPLDFYFGCGLNDENTAVTQAEQCTVTVAGFVAGKNQEVALASYTFTPPAVEVAPVLMLHAVLPNTFLQKLVNITIIQTDPALNTLLVDNFRYNLNKR
ncbi:hypothetical protein ACLMJK_003952 [Lecanora helva]